MSLVLPCLLVLGILATTVNVQTVHFGQRNCVIAETRIKQLHCYVTGRHMLTEMVVDNYIPNDTHMTADESRVQVRAD